MAKGRKRRVKIPFLNQDGVPVSDADGINKIATSYYKDLFGQSVLSSINMSHCNMNQLSDSDRSCLTAPFSVDEIKKVIFEMKHNSAPGPDGFPAENSFKIFGIQLNWILFIFSMIFIMEILRLKD